MAKNSTRCWRRDFVACQPSVALCRDQQQACGAEDQGVKERGSIQVVRQAGRKLRLEVPRCELDGCGSCG